MFKKIGYFLGAGLLALALFAAPQARATDLSLDGNLRLQCDVATASANAATLNNKCGTITTEALTTLKGSSYTLTLTNSVIATGDILFVQVGNATNTAGTAGIQTVNAAAGSAIILVMNNPTGSGGAASGATFNGSLSIKYLVFKP